MESHFVTSARFPRSSLHYVKYETAATRRFTKSSAKTFDGFMHDVRDCPRFFQPSEWSNLDSNTYPIFRDLFNDVSLREEEKRKSGRQSSGCASFYQQFFAATCLCRCCEAIGWYLSFSINKLVFNVSQTCLARLFPLSCGILGTCKLCRRLQFFTKTFQEGLERYCALVVILPCPMFLEQRFLKNRSREEYGFASLSFYLFQRLG